MRPIPFAKTALSVAALALTFLAVPSAQTPAQPAGPAVTEGNFVVRNYRFQSGETLPEVRLHYRTLGAPRKDASGRVTNAVLIGHGTGGTGAQFTSRNFSRQLFEPGQPLDATQFFIVLPDTWCSC